MKLVPLGDKIVLKQLEAEETGKRETPGGRGYRCRTWRKYRWKRSSDAG